MFDPDELSGQRSPGTRRTALGVLNMGTAFGLQCLSGFIVALWPADGGRYPAKRVIGDRVKVKLLGFDDRGKVRLSMRAVDQETGEDIEAKEKAERDAGGGDA